jgi:hypothetical protein
MVTARDEAPALERRPARAQATARGGRTSRRAAVATIITVAALTAGGCGTSSTPTANFHIPHISSQELMRQLEQPTSRGPGGYEVLAGPQHLSLRGIQYTIQGRDALQSWLNSPPSKKATFQQAGRNLAIAFPASKSEIDRKLK